jgi:nucleoside-diphosphate-sugar epimerase
LFKEALQVSKAIPTQFKRWIMSRCAFILGGTGQIGRAVARRLLTDGWQVTLASRGQRAETRNLLELGARTIALDRDQPGSLTKALSDGADLVVDTIAYDSGHADQLIEIQGNVGSYAVISTSSVYKDKNGRTLENGRTHGFPDFEQPITEFCPTVDPGPDNYSTRKVALEQRMLDGASRPVVIVRPGMIYGPFTQHPREWWFVKRILDGRSFIPLAYRGESRFHTSSVENIAALIATAIEARTTCVLNAADPEALSVAEIGAVIADHLGYRGKLLPLDVGDQYGNAPIGGTPWSLPKPFVLSTTAAVKLGFTPITSYAEAVGPYCDWLKQQDLANWESAFPVLAGYPTPLFDYAAEDGYVRSARLDDLAYRDGGS